MAAFDHERKLTFHYDTDEELLELLLTMAAVQIAKMPKDAQPSSRLVRSVRDYVLHGNFDALWHEVFITHVGRDHLP